MAVTERMIATLEKLEGKAHPVGTIVQRGGTKYKKRPDGRWEAQADPNSERAQEFFHRHKTVVHTAAIAKHREKLYKERQKKESGKNDA